MSEGQSDTDQTNIGQVINQTVNISINIVKNTSSSNIYSSNFPLSESDWTKLKVPDSFWYQIGILIFMTGFSIWAVQGFTIQISTILPGILCGAGIIMVIIGRYFGSGKREVEKKINNYFKKIEELK